MQESLVFNKCNVLYDTLKDTGCLTDHYLQSLGFNRDLDYFGKHIDRNLNTILFMRSMCILHEYQRKVRMVEQQPLIGVITASQANASSKVNQILL